MPSANPNPHIVVTDDSDKPLVIFVNHIEAIAIAPGRKYASYIYTPGCAGDSDGGNPFCVMETQETIMRMIAVAISSA